MKEFNKKKQLLLIQSNNCINYFCKPNNKTLNFKTILCNLKYMYRDIYYSE